MVQGETGTQSRYSTRGALNRANWTPRKQAKFLLRKLMIDLKTNVLFSSYFTAVDIFENIATDDVNINEADYGFFGVLGESFDKTGTPLGQYHRKDAFTAMQTLCSLFDDAVTVQPQPVCFAAEPLWSLHTAEETPEDFRNQLYSVGFAKENGAKAFAYWKATNVLTTDYESTVTLDVYGLGETVRLIDLYTGEIHAIPESRMERDEEGKGKLRLKHLPIRDYPLLLTFGNFAE